MEPSEVREIVDDVVAAAVAPLLERQHTLEKRLGETTSELRRLNETFAQARGVIAFIKWASAVAIAGWALIAWAKAHLKFNF